MGLKSDSTEHEVCLEVGIKLGKARLRTVQKKGAKRF